MANAPQPTAESEATGGSANVDVSPSPSPPPPQSKKRARGGVKPKPLPMKTRKVRVYPTQEQRQMLREWMGAVRWTYNQCTAHVNEVGIKGMTIWGGLGVRARAR